MLFAILGILSFTLQNLCCKEYGRRLPDSLFSQSAMIALSMVIVTAIMALLGGARPLTPRGYLIALGFGVCFVLTLASMTLAMSCGHMGITLLIQNSSLMVPAIFGVLVWNEKLTALKAAGIACILVLLALSVGDVSAPADRSCWNKKRWLFFTALSFIGDSLLSIFQGLMSREYTSADSVNFTFWTSVFSLALALLIVLYYVLRRRTGGLLRGGRLRAFCACCAGIGVGTAGGNCFSIMALGYLPSVVLFPLRQGGLVLLMWVLGVLVYREKVNRRGLIMLATGLLGLVLLNL